jgi:hypothetical protein
MTARIRILLGATLFLAFPVSPSIAGDAAAPESASAEATPTIPSADARLLTMAKASGLTSDVVRAAVAYLEEYKPSEATDLDALLKKDSNRFRGTIRQASYEQRNLENLRENDPTAYRLQVRLLRVRIRIEQLEQRYKAVAEEQKPRVEADLSEALGQMFDIQARQEKHQIEQQRQRLQEQEQRLNERMADKARVVDRDVSRRLGVENLQPW